MPRDYDLLAPDAKCAMANGLVTEDWYRTPLDRYTMKALMTLADQTPITDERSPLPTAGQGAVDNWDFLNGNKPVVFTPSPGSFASERMG
ncbi:MAG: hypothetical protein ACSHX3_14915 [Litorimonas sp.]